MVKELNGRVIGRGAVLITIEVECPLEVTQLLFGDNAALLDEDSAG